MLAVFFAWLAGQHHESACPWNVVAGEGLFLHLHVGPFLYQGLREMPDDTNADYSALNMTSLVWTPNVGVFFYGFRKGLIPGLVSLEEPRSLCRPSS